jgi:ppGpp synthetase/RelA/SpoT-type nucleotidyltranferase
MSSKISLEDIEWADKQVEAYSLRYDSYKNYSKVLEDVLQQIVDQIAPQSIVQTRPKEIASFANKIWRKREQFKNPVNQFTDLCGGRIIANNRRQVEKLSDYIIDNFEVDWENSIGIEDRLRPSEFGYRSIHYVVSFKKDDNALEKGIFPNTEVTTKIPQEYYPLKAEIQIRTLLEHSWADFSHKISYKRPFKTPHLWEREMAKLAAFLEEADSQLIRVQDGLQHYLNSYGAYMTKDQIEQEILILKNVLTHDSENSILAYEIGRLAIGLEDWSKAIATLAPYEGKGYLPLDRDLGTALCNLNYAAKKQGMRSPEMDEYERGQRILTQVIDKDKNNVAALCALAGTYRGFGGFNEIKAEEYYQKAFELSPDDPYPLSYYLDYIIGQRRDLSVATSLRPIIKKAYRKSRDLANAGLDIPWSYFNMAKFSLLLDDPTDALMMYAKACQISDTSWPIFIALKSLDYLAPLKNNIKEYETVVRFLNVYLHVKYPQEAKTNNLSGISSMSKPLNAPIVIVSGGTDPAVEKFIQQFKDLLIAGFEGFKGSVISGGTLAGVCQIVGDLQIKYPKEITTIGYIPSSFSHTIVKDERYSDLRTTVANEFSALRTIRYWEDILTSGISPGNVRLIGINGGKNTAVEFRIALALGAKIGIVHESGRASAQMITDPDWKGFPNIVPLPREALAIREFIST